MQIVKLIAIYDVELAGDIEVAKTRIVESISRDFREIHGIDYRAKVTNIDVNIANEE